MKSIIESAFTLTVRILLGLLLCCAVARPDILKPTDEITVWGQTIYNTGNTAVPDSIRVRTYRAGVERFDAWYNEGDAEADTAGAMLFFTDAFGDIDGAGGDGFYLVIVDAYDTDSTLYTSRSWTFTVGTDVGADIFAISGDSASADALEGVFTSGVYPNVSFGTFTTGNMTIDGQFAIINLGDNGPALYLETDSIWSPAIALNPGAGAPSAVYSLVDIPLFADILGDRLLQLSDSGAAQGAASGLTSTELCDSLFNRLVSDTVSNTYMAQLIRNAATAADTTLWAQVDSIIVPLIAHIDSIAKLAGYKGGGFSVLKQHTDVDTFFFGLGTPPGALDTTDILILRHIGAGDGADPDTTWTETWP